MTLRKTNDRINLLALKWKQGSISEEEKLEFNEWYNSHDDSRLEDISGETAGRLKERLYATILSREGISEIKPVRTLFPWRSVAAALLVITLGLGLYSYLSRPQNIPVYSGKPGEPIRPGGNKAYLVLADGKRISLSEASKGQLLEQSGLEITKTGDGQIVYNVVADENRIDDGYNTIETPSGGQFQVLLPDGTKVWLNARSSLRYRPAGMRNARIVELSGEAYFEVAKDPERPFLVNSDEQQVEVLGTHFNVNAYPDEETIKTSLIEGRVRVSAGSTSRVLNPGQGSNLDRQNNRLTVAGINARHAADWKDGLFIFKDEDIASIMRKISRWYDVEVTYEGEKVNKRFGGTISRSKNVKELLDMLELTGSVHFKTEGRRIIVMP